MMRIANLMNILLLSLGVLTLSACEKEEEKEPGNCFDGYMNNGELGIDCGGPCSPCVQPSIPLMSASVNGVLVSFSQKNILSGTNWILEGTRDTVYVSLNFGPDASIGGHDLINDVNSRAIVNGREFTSPQSGSHVLVVSHDTEAKKMSGNFRMILVAPRVPDDPETIWDTLKVESGSFSNLVYP
jgi:hypothetical protein